MKQKPAERPASSERIIRDIKRKTRKLSVVRQMEQMSISLFSAFDGSNIDSSSM
jgi:hypothetical protein